ncbi:hypothetical protein F5144DRAFT_562295 [Chaetomium tenue]|uniref:Uncharacterized protein n=1 Tax=Chaetomium tenue TaxID=1854479 RepID=A0ACB7PIW6_9PEZI|nr:hypothetical protein F5144DRAFT_562295 [Chaetomium globosum]
MADPLSVAGLAAGVVSLGIQVSQGITTYIDALNCRDQDIISVRQRNDSLRKTLRVVETSRSQLEGDHQVATAAIRECLASCNTELNLLENLVVDLTTCDRFTAGFIENAKNKGKRLLYPFSRSKLEQLETRLRNANTALQLALQSLGLSVSHLNTEKLITLEATSYVLSTNFRHVQSEVSAMALPLHDIHGSMSGLEARLDKMEQLLRQVLIQNPAANGTLQEITPEMATGRLLAKPGVLKDISDAAATLMKPSGIGTTMNHHHATRFSNAVSTYTGGSLSCLCRHRRRVRTKTAVWGSLVLSSEAATEQHLPGCPATQVVIGTDRSHKVGLAYTGLRNILNSAIQLSFQISWGAGAWSLSPNFTYYPSVDAETAPVFRILFLLYNSRSSGSLRELAWEQLTVSAVSVILKMFRAHKASPRAVDAKNRSLVYHLVACMTMASDRLVRQFSSHDRPKALFDLLKCLLDNKAPANQYDLHGYTPLSRLFAPAAYGSVTEPLFADATTLILGSNTEDNLACLWTPYPAVYSMVLNRAGRQVGAEGNAVLILHFLASSTGIAEAYGCGPMSLAILSNNPGQVEQLLRNHPATLNERNLFGHTPLHLAADKPSCLQLLVKAADSRLLNQTDESGGLEMSRMTPLETAIHLSGIHCRQRMSGEMCQEHECRCNDCVVILLEADCALPVSNRLQYLMNRASQRCKIQYIRGMKDRRDRLKQLALDNLPTTELQRLGLVSTSVLNSAASRVIQLLKDRGVHIPEALALSTNEPSSVYQVLTSPGDSELFFDTGFHDTGSWCNSNTMELEDISNIGQDLSHLHWLATHGGISLRHLQSSATQKEISVTNYIFWRIGYDVSIIFNRIRFGTLFQAAGFTNTTKSPSLDDCIAWVHEVNAAVLPAELADSCRCKCSPGGCTPLTSLLKGIPGLKGCVFGGQRRVSPTKRNIAEEADSPENDSATEDTDSPEGSVAGDTESSEDVSLWMVGSLSSVARYFTEYLENFGRYLDVRHHTAALRYLTFTALDIPHSCCSGSIYYWEWIQVEEEYVYELRLLDELLVEFEEQIMAILQGPIPGVDGVVRFWKETWVRRMRDVLYRLQGDDLTEDEKRGAEEIGVVWDRPRPLEEKGNPYDSATLEHWMYELEKIEAEC